MKRILLVIIKYIIAFGIAIILLWWSFHSLTAKDINDIKSALLRADYIMLIPVFTILMLSHLFRALRWQQLIHSLGYKAHWFQLLCGVLIGYIANLFVPRAGEIMRCTSISKYNKIPAEKLIGTIVAERAFDVVSLLVITIGTVWIEYDILSSYFKEITTGIKTKLTDSGPQKFFIIGIIICIIIIAWYLLKKFKSHRRTQGIIRIIKGIWLGLISIKDVKNKPLFLIHTILLWTSYVFATWLGCFALEETAHLYIDAGLAMLVLGTFGIIVAPGGLGAYPIAIQKTLNLYGVSENIGLASGWLLWIAQFVFIIVFGILAFMALKFKYAKNETRRSDSK